MTKPYYSDYVRHALRFYSRNQSLSHFRSEADKNNWMSCHKAICDYPDKTRDILVAVYSGYDTLADNVFEAAKNYSIDQGIVWDMIKDFEHKVAKKRGLI